MGVIVTSIKARARELLRGHWVQEYWILDPKTQQKWSPDTHVPDETGRMLRGIEGLRFWLRSRGITNKHGIQIRGCKVCAEGAIWLACALDQGVHDDDTVLKVAESVRRRVPIDYNGDIPAFNDDENTEENDVIKLFK